MDSLEISSDHIVKAIEQQNVQVAAGQIGQPPAPIGQVFQYTIGTKADSAKRTNSQTWSSKPAKRAEWSAFAMSPTSNSAPWIDQTCWLDGKASVALSIYQLPGTNPSSTPQLRCEPRWTK